MVIATVIFGAVFGLVWAIAGYAATRGQRDFSSMTQVVATRYEVLVEHKVAAQARELLGSAARRAAGPVRWLSPSGGFETVAAQPPQPPILIVVEEGALRLSRNLRLSSARA